MENDYWQNDQYGEDDDERSDRLRASRLKGRCVVCGRNPKLGQAHQPDCLYAADSSSPPVCTEKS